jgi:hypothetical protein
MAEMDAQKEALFRAAALLKKHGLQTEGEEVLGQQYFVEVGQQPGRQSGAGELGDELGDSGDELGDEQDEQEPWDHMSTGPCADALDEEPAAAAPEEPEEPAAAAPEEPQSEEPEEPQEPQSEEPEEPQEPQSEEPQPEEPEEPAAAAPEEPEEPAAAAPQEPQPEEPQEPQELVLFIPAPQLHLCGTNLIDQLRLTLGVMEKYGLVDPRSAMNDIHLTRVQQLLAANPKLTVPMALEQVGLDELTSSHGEPTDVCLLWVCAVCVRVCVWVCAVLALTHCYVVCVLCCVVLCWC